MTTHSLLSSHPTLFIASLGSITPSATSVASASFQRSYTALASIKQEDISQVSMLPPKKYKNIHEKLANTDKEQKNNSENIIVAKDKRVASKVTILPASLKKKLATKEPPKAVSPLI